MLCGRAELELGLGEAVLGKRKGEGNTMGGEKGRREHYGGGEVRPGTMASGLLGYKKAVNFEGCGPALCTVDTQQTLGPKE
jgi:hypothetical protein